MNGQSWYQIMPCLKDVTLVHYLGRPSSGKQCLPGPVLHRAENSSLQRAMCFNVTNLDARANRGGICTTNLLWKKLKYLSSSPPGLTSLNVMGVGSFNTKTERLIFYDISGIMIIIREYVNHIGWIRFVMLWAMREEDLMLKDRWNRFVSTWFLRDLSMYS